MPLDSEVINPLTPRLPLFTDADLPVGSVLPINGNTTSSPGAPEPSPKFNASSVWRPKLFAAATAAATAAAAAPLLLSTKELAAEELLDDIASVCCESPARTEPTQKYFMHVCSV